MNVYIGLCTIFITQVFSFGTYPAPPGIEPSDTFQVTLKEGFFSFPYSSFVYISRSDIRASHSHKAKPHRSVSWTSFVFTGSNVLVKVVAPQDFNQCIVRPRGYDITCQRVATATAEFVVRNHTQMMSVEFDYDYGSHRSDIVDKMLVFSDPPETNIPDPGDPKVLYFRHGVHDLNGKLYLNDAIHHVYLAPGSFVMGGFRTTSRHSVTISGRGVLSGARYSKSDFEWSIVNMDAGNGHILEGITIVDTPHFYYRGLSTNNVVRNVKTVAPWTYNTDGVAIGSHGLVEDSFFMANDDTFKLFKNNMTVRRCVVWQSKNGAVFQFGWWKKRIANRINVDQIDVIHTDWCTFRNIPCKIPKNAALLNLAGNTTEFDLHRVHISNVRVEGFCPRLFNFVMIPLATGSVYNIRLTNWTIDGITPNVASNSQLGGSSSGGRLSNWNISNMYINGTCISDPVQANISIDRASVNDVSFSCN